MFPVVLQVVFVILFGVLVIVDCLKNFGEFMKGKRIFNKNFIHGYIWSKGSKVIKKTVTQQLSNNIFNKIFDRVWPTISIRKMAR